MLLTHIAESDLSASWIVAAVKCTIGSCRGVWAQAQIAESMLELFKRLGASAYQSVFESEAAELRDLHGIQ